MPGTCECANERETKRFCTQYRAERSAFVAHIQGIAAVAERERYASLMLNRLMFVYFIQKKGFLDGDPDYLGNHPRRPRQENAQNQVHSFYIAKNAIFPYLFDAAREECAGAFKKDSALWRLLQENPDRYIYKPVLKGVDLALPEEIAAGLSDVTRPGGWNKPADRDYALPTETWREHVARRERGQDVRARLEAGKIHSIDDFITDNLDIRQFARDAIDNAEDPELVRAF